MIISIPADAPPTLDTDLPAAKSRPVASQSRLWRFHDEYALGTRLQVLVNSSNYALAETAARAARNEIARLNLVFNQRLEDSELTRLHRLRRIHASAELFAVVAAAEAWRFLTRGAFDGRMGALLSLWSDRETPTRSAVSAAIAALRASTVTLDKKSRHVAITPNVALSLDAIAKGYIVDAAINAARRASPCVDGLAVDIGGDIRCWGKAFEGRGWRVGIVDAMRPAENAPLVDAIAINNAAIATSGLGPRDRMENGYRSTTLSPFTGRPVCSAISASVVASHAMDADAIATACMVLNPSDSIALVNSLDAVAARIVDAQGAVHESSRWSTLRLAAAPAANQNDVSKAKPKSLPAEVRWPNDWELGVRYIAPDRQDERSADFRTPYMAMWITDEQNRSVYTLFLVGTSAEWQKDNFIWWSTHRERAKQLVDLRSQATALSGRYLLYWNGMDDNWKPLPIGKYVLHLETSQERGKHSYRSLPLEIGRQRFKAELPSIPEAGGLKISFGHYNDRFNADE